MKRHEVILEESAQADVRESYAGGCEYWGTRQARKWARELRTAIQKQLSATPRAFPLAPEDEEFTEEIRQMVVGRYRVMVTIKDRMVHILHVRGAYVNPIRRSEEE
jgi:plasmid stabilization system protein ParE